MNPHFETLHGKCHAAACHSRLMLNAVFSYPSDAL